MSRDLMTWFLPSTVFMAFQAFFTKVGFFR